jgi:phospholipid/cholesterol/gamma-HCH transport system substrate-binding protein
MALTTATNHWKLGLFVVAALLTMVGATFWLGSSALRRESVPLVSYFDEPVQGLDVGSSVKFRGVTIGTVADITLAPDHRNVQVTSDIYVDALRRLGLAVPKKGGQPMDPNLRVQLVSAGITGVRFLQTDFFDPERYPPPTLTFPPPWNYLPSTASTLKSLEDAAVVIVDKLPELVDVAKATLTDLRKTLGSFDRLATGLGADDGSLNRLLLELRSAAVRLETALDEAKLGATTASFRDTSGKVGQAAVTADQTVSNVGDVREELEASLVAFRETLDSIKALADALGRDPSVVLRGPPAERAPVQKTK